MVLTLELTHILLKELNFYIRVSWYNLAEHMFQIEIFAKSEDGGAYSGGAYYITCISHLISGCSVIL